MGVTVKKVLLLIAAITIAGCQEEPTSAVRVRPEKKTEKSKISNLLDQPIELATQANSESQAQSSGLSSASTALVHVNDIGQIQVYVHIEPWSQANVQQLEQSGLFIEVQNEHLQVVQGWIAAKQVKTISHFPFVYRITPPEYAITFQGSVLTEGDSILRAPEFRAFGFDGTGVKVGVISDGANNLNDAVATDDLPAGITTFGTCSGGTCNEGTAMMEIIHDIAPGATLGFGAGLTTLSFISRISDLANTFGADIVVDDIAFPTQPKFEDGSVAEAVEAVADDLVYVSSAGNAAERSYEHQYVDASGFHDFGVASGGASDDTMNITIASGGTLLAFLQWNDAFGSSANDYDLLLYNSTLSTLLAASTETQAGTDDPLESLSYENTTGSTITVRLAVEKFSGVSKIIDLFVFGGTIQEYAISDNSVWGHSALPNVLAVGAINEGEPGNNLIADYSSHGPVEIYFPTAQTRDKPDLVAIDGVAVTGAGGFSQTFFGTSAAAPHVAALAALLKEAFDETSANIRNGLKNGADDLGVAGDDFIYGTGRADVMSAALAMNNGPTANIVTPSTDQQIEIGGSVSFSGSCTNQTSESTKIYSWDFDDSGILASTSQNPGSRTFSTEGIYTVSLTCTDGFGVSSPSPSTVTITVGNPPPPSPVDDDPEDSNSPAENSSSGAGCRSDGSGGDFLLIVWLFLAAFLSRKKSAFELR